MRETPLQLEVRQMEIRLWPEREAAMKRCRSKEQREQCELAWGRKMDAELDAIMQRHGLPGMKWPVDGKGRASF